MGNQATYSYIANSPLISQLFFKQNSTTRMTTSKSYDLLNRLLAMTNLPSAESSLVFNYAHNAANQRTAITNADGSRWAYAYDSLGQVTNGNKFWSDGAAVLGQQFGYAFDDIGNRRSATSGGDANGRSKRTQLYTANNLNQYTSRTVPGYLDILGTATNTATVTVNSRSTSRKGDYYRGEVNPDNSVNPVHLSVTNTAVLASGTNDFVTNGLGNVFVPKALEVFRHDADGNQTNDGRWTLTWDGENRLVQMQSLGGAPIGSSNRLTFTYDQQGRRISQVAESFMAGAWSITLSNRYVYDGWNLLAELNATNNMVIHSFMWGLDLSGSMQGAGGVGGLLAITTTNAGTHFVGFDGNGNVTLLVSASTGAASAHYEYNPFGGLLRATGPMALLNPFRFSTKYTDGESGFNYYGYRFYNSSQGRWVNRDRIEETGGRALYVFLNNNPANLIDDLGNAPMGWPVLPPPGYPPSLPPGGQGPGPEETAVFLLIVTTLTPIPGDEVAVGTTVGGWIIKKVIGSSQIIRTASGQCCRIVKVVLEKAFKRKPGNYQEATRDALNEAFKDGYNAIHLEDIPTSELKIALEKLRDGLSKLKANPRCPNKQIEDFERRIRMLEDHLNKHTK